MVCAACLRQAERAVRLSERPAVRRLLRALQLCLGLVLTWLFFYWTGEALLRLPSAFHDGTVWRGSWLNSP